MKLPSATPCQQEAGDLCIGSMGYADDTYPLRQEGSCMRLVGTHSSKGEPHKFPRDTGSATTKYNAKVHGAPRGALPLQTEFRSLGVGIRISLL